MSTPEESGSDDLDISIEASEADSEALPHDYAGPYMQLASQLVDAETHSTNLDENAWNTRLTNFVKFVATELKSPDLVDLLDDFKTFKNNPFSPAEADVLIHKIKDYILAHYVAEEDEDELEDDEDKVDPPNTDGYTVEDFMNAGLALDLSVSMIDLPKHGVGNIMAKREMFFAVLRNFNKRFKLEGDRKITPRSFMKPYGELSVDPKKKFQLGDNVGKQKLGKNIRSFIIEQAGSRSNDTWHQWIGGTQKQKKDRATGERVSGEVGKVNQNVTNPEAVQEYVTRNLMDAKHIIQILNDALFDPLIKSGVRPSNVVSWDPSAEKFVIKKSQGKVGIAQYITVPGDSLVGWCMQLKNMNRNVKDAVKKYWSEMNASIKRDKPEKKPPQKPKPKQKQKPKPPPQLDPYASSPAYNPADSDYNPDSDYAFSPPYDPEPEEEAEVEAEAETESSETTDGGVAQLMDAKREKGKPHLWGKLSGLIRNNWEGFKNRIDVFEIIGKFLPNRVPSDMVTVKKNGEYTFRGNKRSQNLTDILKGTLKDSRKTQRDEMQGVLKSMFDGEWDEAYKAWHAPPSPAPPKVPPTPTPSDQGLGPVSNLKPPPEQYVESGGTAEAIPDLPPSPPTDDVDVPSEQPVQVDVDDVDVDLTAGSSSGSWHDPSVVGSSIQPPSAAGSSIHPLIPAIQPHPVLPPVHVLPANLAQQQETAAWAAYWAANPRSHAMNSLYAVNDKIPHWLEYIPQTQRIEAIHRREVSFRPVGRGGRVRSRWLEEHQLKPSPFEKTRNFEDIHTVSRLMDPLHDIPGSLDKIGSYISFKKQPQATHICIKKGVQKKALFMLAERIVSENKFVPARLLIKRRVKGRYRFQRLVTSKKLASTTAEVLAKVFSMLMKKRAKYITLKQDPVIFQ